MAKKLVRKVKKVKRKYGQKQKQKQSQKVIINIGKPKPTKKRRSKPKPFISETLSTVLIQPQQPAFSTADLQTLLNSQRQTSIVGPLAQTAKAKSTVEQGTNTLNVMDEETIAVAEPAPRPTPRPTPRYEAEPLPSRPSRRYGLGTVKKQVWRERLISGVEERIAQEQATRQPRLTSTSLQVATPATGRFAGNTRGVGEEWERAMIEQELTKEDLPKLTEGDIAEMREQGYNLPYDVGDEI